MKTLKYKQKANGHAVFWGGGLVTPGVIKMLEESGYRKAPGTKLQYTHFTTAKELEGLTKSLSQLGVLLEEADPPASGGA